MYITNSRATTKRSITDMPRKEKKLSYKMLTKTHNQKQRGEQK